MRTCGNQRGQVLPLALGLATLVLAGILALMHYGVAHLAALRAQAAADQVALSTAAAPADSDPDAVARQVADGWGASVEEIEAAAGRVAVVVSVRGPLRSRVRARAVAGVAGAAIDREILWARGGGYSGPLVLRDGVPLCPAVAAGFDRMDRAAAADGVDLVAVSGFRSDREQAALFRRHPDPRWVAPPGRSRHRDATEIDIASGGGAWPWLARNGGRFNFVQRYDWEPWHWGYRPGCNGQDPPFVQLIPDPSPGRAR